MFQVTKIAFNFLTPITFCFRALSPCLTILFECFLSPWLESSNLYQPEDPTRGRYLQAPCGYELNLEADLDIITTLHRVFIDKEGKPLVGEDVKILSDELKDSRFKRWIFYKTWISKRAQTDGPAAGSDVVMLHGYGDYAGKWAAHCPTLLRAGYRVIVPDMPGHGRSTGLHAYIETSNELPDAVYATLYDIDTRLGTRPRKRQIFGVSLGGYTGISYCLCVTTVVYRTVTKGAIYIRRHGSRIPINSMFLACPMIGIAPESDHPGIIKAIGKTANSIMGRVPLIPPPGLATVFAENPLAALEYWEDVRSYHGNMRVSTAIAFLGGLEANQNQAGQFKVPIRIIHGDRDKVTSHRHSKSWIEQIPSKDKSISIYANHHHVMFSVGRTEEEDRPRQAIFKDRDTWLLEHL